MSRDLLEAMKSAEKSDASIAMSAQSLRKKISGKVSLVLDSQNHQSCEPAGVRHYMADIDTTACELLANEAAHMFVADPCQHG